MPLEDNRDYITLITGRNGWLVVRMVYSKPMDMYQIACMVDRKVYRDHALAMLRATQEGITRGLEVKW